MILYQMIKINEWNINYQIRSIVNLSFIIIIPSVLTSWKYNFPMHSFLSVCCFVSRSVCHKKGIEVTLPCSYMHFNSEKGKFRCKLYLNIISIVFHMYLYLYFDLFLLKKVREIYGRLDHFTFVVKMWTYFILRNFSILAKDKKKIYFM